MTNAKAGINATVKSTQNGLNAAVNSTAAGLSNLKNNVAEFGGRVQGVSTDAGTRGGQMVATALNLFLRNVWYSVGKRMVFDLPKNMLNRCIIEHVCLKNFETNQVANAAHNVAGISHGMKFQNRVASSLLQLGSATLVVLLERAEDFFCFVDERHQEREAGFGGCAEPARVDFDQREGAGCGGKN